MLSTGNMTACSVIPACACTSESSRPACLLDPQPPAARPALSEIKAHQCASHHVHLKLRTINEKKIAQKTKDTHCEACVWRETLVLCLLHDVRHLDWSCVRCSHSDLCPVQQLAPGVQRERVVARRAGRGDKQGTNALYAVRYNCGTQVFSYQAPNTDLATYLAKGCPTRTYGRRGVARRGEGTRWTGRWWGLRARGI